MPLQETELEGNSNIFFDKHEIPVKGPQTKNRNKDEKKKNFTLGVLASK